jgi:hypothetical protein
MPLFVVLLLVFGLRDVLVTLHAARRGTGFGEIEAPGVLGAHGAMRQEPFERLAFAGGAGGDVTSPNQLLELVAAAATAVLVNRHRGTVLTRRALRNRFAAHGRRVA